MGPSFFSIRNSPCNFGASLSFGWVVVMFFPESQTFCPSLSSTSCSIVFFFISSAMTSRLDFVSSLIWERFSSCHSILRMSDLGSIYGMNEGLNPYRS